MKDVLATRSDRSLVDSDVVWWSHISLSLSIFTTFLFPSCLTAQAEQLLGNNSNCDTALVARHVSKSARGKNPCSVIFPANSHRSMLVLSKDSEIDQSRPIELKAGKLIVFARKTPKEILINGFHATMPAQCVGLFEINKNNVVRVSNLSGQAITLLVPGPHLESLCINAWEEIFILRNSATNDCVMTQVEVDGNVIDLVPNDEIPREPITCCSPPCGVAVTKRLFDASVLVQTDEMLASAELLSASARRKISQLKNSVGQIRSRHSQFFKNSKPASIR
jgi:hypothetical protein